MSLISVYKLSESFGFGTLFEDVTFNLNEGDRIGIVGPNGCGKSTLLKIIAGVENPTSGTVSIKKDATMTYLQQNHPETDMVCIDYIKSSLKDFVNLDIQIKKYEELMNSETDEKKYNKYVEKYCELVERFSNIGGYDIDVKVNEIIDGLRIDKKILSQPFASLSGGEKTLVSLAKCLMENPNIFLMDEPTNHLDIDRIEWLENYIKNFNGAIIMVSHDRYLLDKIATKILDLRDIEAKLYNMNYSNYLIDREKEFARQMADYKVRQQQIKKLEEEARYFLQKANETGSPLMYNRSKQMREKLQKLKDIGIKKPTNEKSIQMNFNENKKRSTIAFDIENFSVKKPNNEYILKEIDLTIKYNDRVALIGQNGSGKSTFIKSIVGKENLNYTGNITVGPSTNIGYLPQIITFEEPKLRILEYFQKETYKDNETARRILNNYKFGEDVIMKRIGSLSEGEKIRLRLAVLLQKSINCLIFDEPTNHIDIETKEVLENAIASFDGTFIFVSHDRYFINKFANKLVEFKNSGIKIYEGNYDYYKEKNDKIVNTK